ncbi:HAMP domain-containing sensor histidine kinase [Sporosarcina sp. GW1-11]|uniref:sensor histidine kinase n=1 Tax=Sporosarcina sp. GW1-11 TaxID=2899126 RepID=UPI00294C6DFD|nr:HAMP domain-containing sensor histidine kinase [Sporosarcina sp. GW1-11]MDV6377979.1 HAMP domain-containing sensor histidine kinase [Sporosarcina sp. GW1-11]
MNNLNLSKKMLLVFLGSIICTILFSFFFIHYLYTDLYKERIKESIMYQGNRTAAHYHYGELSDSIIEKIQWYNIVSEYEIIVVDRLDDLTSHFPYQLDYQMLVDDSDEDILETGQPVMKEGYVKELNREIFGGIFPIKGENGLIGFIYIYVPLAAIQDVFRDSLPIMLLVGTTFFIILFLILQRVWRSLFEPLKTLQTYSESVSKGDYSNRLDSQRSDEIGKLATAFNVMSHSLAEQDQRKKEFTSNIVHELRTPLTYISGYAQLSRDKIDSSPEDVKQYLSTIEKETERLKKLIHDLVELNHLEQDFYTLVNEPIAIAQLLFDTLELFAIRLKDKGIQLQAMIDENLILQGDPKRLQQVFYNTIDNAVKYAERSISIQLAANDYGVIYRIANDGVTIGDEDIARIGERFFRTDKARNRTTGGTGLGLSIVKEIVRLHGGTFNVSNETTETIVTITLPVFDERSEG